MGPKTIVYFRRIFLVTVLLDLLNASLRWDRIIERVATKEAALATVAGAIEILWYLLIVTLIWLVSRHRNRIAMWVLTVLTALGVFVFLVGLVQFGGLLGSDIVPLSMMFTGQVVACALLFTPSARRWMRREDKLLDVFH
ncbi:MAG: hypothetical protein J2P54_19135 [Bradyrhizobiaceae bacterium]|nr:hypothetical protein [Bradyrhizobiaceae bacterium]